MDWNPDKWREVYCPNCKMVESSNLPAPYHSCGHEMITIVKSVVDGRRLTGELATGNSSSTQ